MGRISMRQGRSPIKSCASGGFQSCGRPPCQRGRNEMVVCGFPSAVGREPILLYPLGEFPGGECCLGVLLVGR